MADRRSGPSQNLCGRAASARRPGERAEPDVDPFHGFRPRILFEGKNTFHFISFFLFGYFDIFLLFLVDPNFDVADSYYTSKRRPVLMPRLKSR